VPIGGQALFIEDDMLELVIRYRFVGVIVLLGLAAALATPRNRLPLALRGLRKTLAPSRPEEPVRPVSVTRRLVAFLLVILALALALQA